MDFLQAIVEFLCSDNLHSLMPIFLQQVDNLDYDQVKMSAVKGVVKNGIFEKKILKGRRQLPFCNESDDFCLFFSLLSERECFTTNQPIVLTSSLTSIF